MDVYKIGISLALASNAPQVLQALSAQLLHVHTHVHNLQGSMNKLKLAIGGAFAIAGGTAVLGIMGKLVDHGNDLVKVQRDMAQAGVSNVQVQEAYAKAWDMTAKYQNVSAVEAMKLINDGRMTFGDQDVATHHAGDFVEMASFLKSYEGGKHAHASADVMREVNAAVKSGELAAKISPEEMGEHIKQMIAMKIAYGEGMKVNTYLTGVRAAGVALRNASDEFRYGVFPALLQENSSTGGVMLMTLFNKVVSGVGNTTKSLEKMTELGLLDKKMLDYDKGGHVKGLHDPGAFKNSMEAAVNMFAWTHDTFKPLLDKKLDDEHLTGQDRKVREAQYISAYFPNRNASKAITEMLQQFTKLEKDAAQMAGARKAMNMEVYTSGSWDYQKQAFMTQWTNFIDAVGAPLVVTATEVLARINNVMKEFGQWAKEAGNAEFLKYIGIGLSFLAAAIVGVGGGAILAAIGSTAGWLILGITLLGTTITWLYNNWPTWDGIKSAFTEFISWIGTIPAQIKAFFGFGTGETPKGAEAPVPLPNDSEGGAAFDRPTGPYVKRKQSWNLTPPPPAEIKSTVAAVYLDGRKVGDAVVKHITNGSQGGIEGTPYHDPTQPSSMPFDTSLAIG